MISHKISWWHISVIRVIQVVKVIQLIQVMHIYDPTFESFLFSNQHCWTGDGCNSVICDCSVDAKNAKTGKVSCFQTHVACPPKGSKDSGGEFPIFQNLFLCVLFFVQNIFQANRQRGDPFSRHGEKCTKEERWETHSSKGTFQKRFSGFCP